MNGAVTLVVDDAVYCNDNDSEANINKCGHVSHTAEAIRNAAIGGLACLTCITTPPNGQTILINRQSQANIIISEGFAEDSTPFSIGPKQFSIPIKPEMNFWYSNEENFNRMAVVEDGKQALIKEGFLAMVNKKVPIPYAACGVVFFALFSAFLSILISGINSGKFLFNPIYAFLLALGFLGMFVTCVIAIVDWRKKYRVYRREKRKRAI